MGVYRFTLLPKVEKMSTITRTTVGKSARVARSTAVEINDNHRADVPVQWRRTAKEAPRERADL